jgi:hypothetical protein
MKIDYALPRPTEEELNLGYKTDYFQRIIDMDLTKKYNITDTELYNWIHHNYNSVFLTNEELALNKFKKLIIK